MSVRTIKKWNLAEYFLPDTVRQEEDIVSSYILRFERFIR